MNTYTRWVHPGLIYPENIKPTPKPKRRHKAANPWTMPNRAVSLSDVSLLAEWGYTTLAAAGKMGVTVASARQYMHRHKVPYRTGMTANKTVVYYWEKSGVEHAIAEKIEEVNSLPDGYVTRKELSKIMGVSVTACDRYCQKFEITGKLVRLKSGKSGIPYRIYPREEVSNLVQTLAKTPTNQSL